MIDYKKVEFYQNDLPFFFGRSTGQWLSDSKDIVEQILHNSSIAFEIIFENMWETIYLLEGCTFVYVGIVKLSYVELQPDYTTKQKNPDGTFSYDWENRGNHEGQKNLVICELNYNEFKGITPSSFHKINKERERKKQSFVPLGIIIHNFPYYSYNNQLRKACVEHCAKLLNEKYDVYKAIDDFKGVPCAIILYKITKGGKNGFAALWTNKVDRAHEFAKEGYKRYIPYCLDFKIKWTYSGEPFVFKASENFKTIYKESLFNDGTEIKDKKEINQYISYRINQAYDDTYKIDHCEGQGYLLLQKAIESAERGDFNCNDFYCFTDGRTKWKTEFLVYQIVKRLYPKQTIYQYGPSFLKTKKGQLTYDVFIANLNVAIEYQGEQHFKQIDFFGGLEDFKARQKRDALKKRLSAANGVKLIYVNYDEDVSEKLIAEKIRKAQI